jgi:Ca2+-transporting ATPase
MALTAFACALIAVALNLRYPDKSIFHRETLSNYKLWLSFLWAIVGMVLITELRILREVFNTSFLTLEQWALCLVAAAAVLLLGELIKPLLRLIPRKYK